MKKENMFLYLTAYLALLIPIPGRFVYGFTIMTEVIFLSIIGSLSVLIIEKIKFEQLENRLTNIEDNISSNTNAIQETNDIINQVGYYEDGVLTIWGEVVYG